MFERFRKRRSATGPAVPPGSRVYAVGDVHGRDDLLRELIAKIEDDRAARGPARDVIVFLGDLIDRGPASCEVVERLRGFAPDNARLVFLAGNHEEVLLRILDGHEELVGDWLRFGGADCLRSYGLDPASLPRSAREAVLAIRKAIPGSHAEFLRSFSDTVRIGDYLFVHAGIRPGLPLAEQSQSDLRWIRRDFLDDDSDHGFIVVHGHTISSQVDQQPNRVGIDTGAYHSGVLSAIGLAGDRRWFLQTGASEAATR